MEISIIIPTRARSAILRRALAGYARQTVPRGSFEVLVVEDGPAGDARPAAEAWGARYVDSPHRPGPAAARNAGIERAAAPLVLLTGDDMVPAPDLLERHLEAHRQHPGGAVLGRVLWHPDVTVTPFMCYLVTRGGQFSFHKITNPEDCGYRFFYGSNVSLERERLLAEPFDEGFPHPAMEDIDVGYRLCARGLVVRYRPAAVVYHWHPIERRAYRERMRQAGASARYFVRKHCQDKALRRTWIPFEAVPGGAWAVIVGGWLLSLLPPCRLKWYGFLSMSYAQGVARAGRAPEGAS